MKQSLKTNSIKNLDRESLSRIIEMAWEDRIPFEAIKSQFELSEKDVIAVMRKELKSGSFRLWRQRVGGRKTKHLKLSLAAAQQV